MKHKNAEMIKAKVDNMELVVFYRLQNEEWWQPESDHATLPDDIDFDYFLCLPQHKEACLHWLNGGSVQYRIALDVWTDAADNESNAAWTPDNLFVDDQVEFRIKPKKEKRVIGVNKDGRTTSHYAIDDKGCYAVDEIRITGKGNPDEWQFIEIEVEV